MGEPKAAQSSRFADVPHWEYYAKAVAWAVGLGVTAGTDKTTFSPEQICTRAQIVTFLHRDSKHQRPNTPWIQSYALYFGQTALQSRAMCKGNRTYISQAELKRTFEGFKVEQVLEAIRVLARTTDKPPSMREILEAAHRQRGTSLEGNVGWHWDQYIAGWRTDIIDGYPYESVDAFTVKVYDDGRVEVPSGRKVKRAELIRQHIIKEVER